MKLFIGLMSGTSMDGIDAALVDVSTNQLLTGITHPYTEKAYQMLRRMLEAKTVKAFAVTQLSTIIGQEFAQAVKVLLHHAGVSERKVIAIGSHGQTLAHDAYADIPYTLQIGCGHTIAERTRMTVVADFRTRDLVVGGQGAPFAPIYHQALFRAKKLPIAIINIGGIANVSYLLNDKAVYGYDIGPGNCLMDAWVQTHRNLAYDKNGEWAASGVVIEPLLSALLAEPYFQLSNPKSIGKEYFSEQWLSQFLLPEYKAKDVQATLLALTAKSIADALHHSGLELESALLCGGGAHNGALLKALNSSSFPLQVQSTAFVGVNPDFIEAMMFAWLAEKTLSHTRLDLSRITGAKTPIVLGVIYAPGIDKLNSLEV